MRSNAANTGKAFEKIIELKARTEWRKELKLCKLEPPTRTIGTGAARTIIYLANPFLDFIGVLTPSGKQLNIELKSTSSPRLPFKRAGGLSSNQWEAMLSWHRAGAVVLLLWEFNGRVLAMGVDEILANTKGGSAKALIWQPKAAEPIDSFDLRKAISQ